MGETRQSVKIGDLSKRTGWSAHTIRYYERIGLLPPAPRGSSKQREYDSSILPWIEFLGRLRTTGMPIRDMVRYAALRTQGAVSEVERKALLVRHRDHVRGHVADLQACLSALDTKIAGYGDQHRMEQINDADTKPRRHADERFQRGLLALNKIDGHGGQKVVDALADIAPEFGRYLIEFLFGDIYSRSGLDLRSREIATIAALTAMGNAAPQLKVHIQAGLNVGLNRDEVVEIIMQMAVYAGFPAALNGLFAAKEVFAT